jgi:phosphate transport system substrate-binding protein
MIKKMFLPVFFVLFLFSFLKVYASEAELLIEGQEKTVEFVAPWADKFQLDNPGVAIRVVERKVEEGFADLISGDCDIVISRIEPKGGIPGKNVKIKKTAVAEEGVTFVVNPQNPVNKLTVIQLGDILSGKIMNWEDVGGVYGEITIYGPPVNSWTNNFIKESILNPSGAEHKIGVTSRAINLFSTKEIRQQVVEQPQAIGYFPGVYDSADLKIIAVGSDKSAEYIYPLKERTLDNRYPLRRPLFFWTKGEVKPAVKRFIDCILSKDYQDMLSSRWLYQVKGE